MCVCLCSYFGPAAVIEFLLSLMEGDALLATRSVCFWTWMFFLMFFITEGLHRERRMAHGWTVPNINTFCECSRKGKIVWSPKNYKQGKTVWATMAFPVPAAITGVCVLLSWTGWMLLAPNLQHQQVHRTAAVVVRGSPAPFCQHQMLHQAVK